MAYLACDPKKFWRARQEVMFKTRVSSEKLVIEVSIKSIFVNGRKHPTLILIKDSVTKTFCRRIEKQEGISVTSEPDGSYSTHYIPSKGPNKPAKEAAIEVYNWMVPRGIDQTIIVIGSDSTNSMTGSGNDSGLLTHLEKLIGRKCFHLICMLHTNKLPLRHLIANLDGPTNSKDGFKGSIGKLLSKINQLKRLEKFEPIRQIEPLIKIPDDILKSTRNI